MRAIAKKTSFMNASGKQWITQGKEYELAVSKYRFIDDAGDSHAVTVDLIDNYFEIPECSFCIEHEEDDTLYTYTEWDGGVGFDYIPGVKYCPLCGNELK